MMAMNTFTQNTSTEVGNDAKVHLIDTTVDVIARVEEATGRRLVRQAVDAFIEDLVDSQIPLADLDVDRVADHIIELINDGV
jgi:hypothetical protein